MSIFMTQLQMGQSIQEWTKWNLWKTAFKKFKVIWSAQADHITSNFLKALFHSLILWIQAAILEYFVLNHHLLINTSVSVISWYDYLSTFAGIIGKYEKLCKEREMKFETFMLEGEHKPAHMICKLAEEKNAASITVGQRGLGTISRALLGSTSDYVLHHSRVPVMVVPTVKKV